MGKPRTPAQKAKHAACMRKRWVTDRERLLAKKRAYYATPEGKAAHKRYLETQVRKRGLPSGKALKRASYEKWKPKFWKEKRGWDMFYRITKFCRGTGTECNLTKEWLQAKVDAGLCELSGLPLDMETKRGPNSPSIDRIDPRGGYTKENCRVILWFLNHALSNKGEQYAIQVFRAVVEKHDRDNPPAWRETLKDLPLGALSMAA